MALRVRLAVLLGLLVSAMPAEAQTPVQSLFGYGPPPRVYRYPYRYPAPYGGPFMPHQPYDDEVRPSPLGGTYRTLCVRLCDGYYFPISSAATQGTLAHDADICSASCDSEARLFYHPNVGGDVESMVDLTGMAYGSLPNAFKYRKTMVESCRCRPQPWSEAERDRHRAYLEGRSPAGEPAGDMSKDAGPKDAEVIAGGDKPTSRELPELPGIQDARAIPRPSPIPRQIEPMLPGYSSSRSDARRRF